MGRAIVTGGDGGLYTGRVQFDARVAQVAIAAIDAEVIKINEQIIPANEKIVEINQQITAKDAEYNTLATTYNEAIRLALLRGKGEDLTHLSGKGMFDLPFDDFRFTMPDLFIRENAFDISGISNYEAMYAALKAAPEPMDEAVKDAYNELLQCAVELHTLINQRISVEKYRDMLRFRQEALGKRKLELQTATAQTDVRPMWCADLTTSLTGEVDTLEVIGAPTQILVQPGGTSNLLDEHGTAGKLCNIMAMSPAGAGLAWALLPGWQKWRPTYRVGTIHSINYESDTASVNLDAAESIAQDLDVNQGNNLTAIPVEYMECNSGAFDEGDRVVVEFTGQVWNQGPKVIGFETNPKPCGGHVYVCGGDGNQGPARITRMNSKGEIVWSQTYAFDGFFYSVAVAGASVFACGRKNWNYTLQTDRGFLIKVSAATGDEQWRIVDLWPAYQVAKAGTGVACGTSYTEIFNGSRPNPPSPYPIATYRRDVYAKVTKYDVFGELEWEKSWQHLGPWEDSLAAANAVDLYGVSVMGTDTAGHIYCGGVDGLYSTAMRKLSQDLGETLWTHDYDSRGVVFNLNRLFVALNGFVFARTIPGLIYMYATDIPFKYNLPPDLDPYYFIEIDATGRAIVANPPATTVSCVDLQGNTVWTTDVGHSVYDVTTG